ncbi:leucyl aminopeptidase family protein [Legionella spiritensis]|uniref:leucyl aminopeptidase family protein n=1 Tax=Legionella spiritensis TaxID=452 RepID=UPI000F6BFF68|nr:leucyl aminopeptidase family protein [Legionella spiritensis]VEG90740.1 aminopeptidase [Legionella spiritensis]
MQTERFYRCQSDHAIPLYLITRAQWDNQDIEISPREQNILDNQQFKGQAGKTGIIYDDNGQIRTVFVGQGDATDARAMAHAATLLPPGTYRVQQELSFFAQINWTLAQYAFDRYKKRDASLRYLMVTKDKLPALKAMCDAIFMVRDLINTPTNDMGPEQLALVASDLAKVHQAELKQWCGDELLSDNFPAIHAVGRASASVPRLLQLTWGKEHQPRVTLVGKGVCFDSGGLDIKPAANMRLMKKDMGGAAHVLGLAHWIMATGLPVRLQVLIPAVENAVGPESFRPGDVLTMRNGITVEVDNTDAEGRLVLADALVKACEDNPDLLIDFATLTGAARVAVGTDIAAMFTADDELATDLTRLSVAINDPVWRLPLFDDYEALLDSSVADLVNCSTSPYAGATTAALFLKRFISTDVSWVHFDIMAWNVTGKPGKPEGGEAMAIRTIAQYLQDRFA